MHHTMSTSALYELGLWTHELLCDRRLHDLPIHRQEATLASIAYELALASPKAAAQLRTAIVEHNGFVEKSGHLPDCYVCTQRAEAEKAATWARIATRSTAPEGSSPTVMLASV